MQFEDYFIKLLKMIKLNHVLIFIYLLIISGQKIYACECSFNNLEKEIENSDYILTAKIIEQLDSIYPTFYKIKINEIWKGEKIEILTTGTGGGDCGMDFKIGKEYLIYGNYKNGNINTNRCSRTIELDKTGDIDYLNYQFHQTNYDTINFTVRELRYLKQNLILKESDSLLNINTNLIFNNDKLISKKELIGINPKILSIEFRYLSSGEKKMLKPDIREKARSGVLILYDEPNPKPIKRYKFIRRLNNCTAGNNG